MIWQGALWFKKYEILQRRIAYQLNVILLSENSSLGGASSALLSACAKQYPAHIANHRFDMNEVLQCGLDPICPATRHDSDPPRCLANSAAFIKKVKIYTPAG